MKKSATMSDVAERAGVSKVAVSVVLHGSHTNTRVAESTRQRIVQAAQDLQYTPNGVARALRRRRMNIIGLYLGDRSLDTHGLFLAEIVSGLQAGCREHRKDLLIHGTFRGQSIGDIYSELMNGKIDGLIMFAEHGDPLVARLAASSVPVIAVADAVPPLPSVVVDDQAGSCLLADYLAQKGHRRILYRKGPAAQTSARRRYTAFCAAAAAQGMTVLEDAALKTDPVGVLSAQEKAYLADPAGQRPTAIVCWADKVADRVIEYCRSQGLRVPGDLAVVGFDGIVPELRPATRLTTIRAPWSEVARKAVELLVGRMEGKDVPQETVLPVELVIGETA